MKTRVSLKHFVNDSRYKISYFCQSQPVLDYCKILPVLSENFSFALYTANNYSIFWEKNSLGSTKVCFIKKPPIRNVENFLKLNFDLIQTCKILHKENH